MENINKDNRKSKVLHVRLSDSEYQSLLVKANIANMNVANYTRNLIAEGDVIYVDKKEIRDLNFQLKRIGNNINQIARYINYRRIKDDVPYNEIFTIKDSLKIIAYMTRKTLDTFNVRKHRK